MSGLEMGGYGNMKDCIVGRCRGRVLKEMTGKGAFQVR